MVEFLEEQLARIRQMLDQMSEAHSRVIENTKLIQRDREALHKTPIHDVRDCRTHHTHDPLPESHQRHRTRPWR